MPLAIEPISPMVGAFVRMAAEDTVRDTAPARILEALDRYGVLVFPEIGMSDDIFLELTALLGDRHENTVIDDGSAVSAKGIFRIALDKDERTQREFILGNDYWHMDGMSYPVPVRATLLKCESAPSEGGDTGFANLHAAYDALPETMKRRLAPLKVGHCLSAVLSRLYDAPTPDDFDRWDAIFPRIEHPLVWAQEDGRTAMLIGSTASDIVGLEQAEGRALLDELLDWATQERFTYRHRWSTGDLVIFNNPAMLHRSYPYSDSARRVMHRTTLKGREATGAISPLQAEAIY